MKTLPTYKDIWKIAMPLLFGALAENIVVVTDTAFLARVGELELAASAIAGAFYIILFVVGAGFGTGTQILISRRNGEENFTKIGPIAENSLYFIWMFSAIIVVFGLTFADKILSAAIASESIADAATRFLHIRVFTLFFSLGCVILSRFFIGIQFTKYVGLGALVVAVSNFIFDYLLIFGKFGFPKMGLEGAALAAVLAEIAGFAFFVIIILRKVDLKKYNLFQFKKPNFSIARKTFNLAGFTMLQNFISIVGWFLFFVIIEKTGEKNLAVTNIVRSYFILILTPLWAFSSTVSTLVSNAIGAGQRRYVFPIVRRVATFGAIIMTVIFIFTICFPNAILSIYTTDPVLIEMSINGLYIVALSTVLGGVAWIIFMTVSATGNPEIAVIIEVFTTVAYVFAIYTLANTFADRISLVWLSEIVYAVVMGVGSVIYLSTGHWKKKVI
ncbi:MAG: MATE family efflux transporter [Bacteroidales bacterium]|jgi:putative MATE family efflux protein|nr:MATE family efflux transporter [Bacteroidales bacterium]